MTAIYHQVWTTPAAKSANEILLSKAGPNATTATYAPDGARATGGVAYLPYARNVVVTVTHATAVVAESGVISGYDIYGKQISETWSVTAGGTSKTYATKTAFSRVTQITITAATDASANTNTVGQGDVLGLDVKLSIGGTGAAIKELAAGSIVTNGVFVASNLAANNDPRGTYAPNSIPNGTNSYEVWILSDDPEWSATPRG
jgi:hypothetical protein